MSKPSEKKKLKFQCPNCKSNNLLLVDFCREYSPVTSITSTPGSGPLSYNGQVIFDNEIGDVEDKHYDDNHGYACANCISTWPSMDAINTAGGFIPDDEEDEGN